MPKEFYDRFDLAPIKIITSKNFKYNSLLLIFISFSDCTIEYLINIIISKPRLRPSNTSLEFVGMYSTKTIHSVIAGTDTEKCK